MDKAKILKLYDHEMRENPHVSVGCEVERLELVTRITGTLSGAEFGNILFSRVNKGNASQEIKKQSEHYSRLGVVLEWKLYEQDEPTDLADRLLRLGFSAGESETLLVAEPKNLLQGSSDPKLVVKKITDLNQLRDMAEVDLAVWDEDSSDRIIELQSELKTAPKNLSVYFAYWNGVLAAKSWIRFHPERSFADLWGGGTKPEFRKRGVYQAMVRVRAQEAFERGIPYLTIDASPMSRPILEKRGFEKLAVTVPYTKPPTPR